MPWITEVIVSYRRQCLSGIFLGLALAGCAKEEEIGRYQVPHVEPLKFTAAAPKKGRPPDRLLAALFQRGERMWFFKVEGSREAVAEVKPGFDTFLRTVRFPDQGKAPVEWTLPPGWKEDPKRQSKFVKRYNTLVIPTDSQELELTVTTFEKSSILENVNRWRKQVGLPEVPEQRLKEVTQTIQVGGVEALVVDVSRPEEEVKKPPTRPRPGDVPFDFQPPSGWMEYATNSDINVIGYKVREGNLEAKTTIGSAGGSLEENLKIWAQQVQMDQTQAAKALGAVQEIRIDGVNAKFIDLANPKASTPNNHILVVVVPHRGANWFIKMSGPTELVSRQRATFETFARSIRFEGKGGQP